MEFRLNFDGLTILNTNLYGSMVLVNDLRILVVRIRLSELVNLLIFDCIRFFYHYPAFTSAIFSIFHWTNFLF